MVTGSVDPAESLMLALRREVREEVGMELDTSYRPKYLGGWHVGCYADLQAQPSPLCQACRCLSVAPAPVPFLLLDGLHPTVTLIGFVKLEFELFKIGDFTSWSLAFTSVLFK